MHIGILNPINLNEMFKSKTKNSIIIHKPYNTIF